MHAVCFTKYPRRWKCPLTINFLLTFFQNCSFVAWVASGATYSAVTKNLGNDTFCALRVKCWHVALLQRCLHPHSVKRVGIVFLFKHWGAMGQKGCDCYSVPPLWTSNISPTSTPACICRVWAYRPHAIISLRCAELHAELRASLRGTIRSQSWTPNVNPVHIRHSHMNPFHTRLPTEIQMSASFIHCFILVSTVNQWSKYSYYFCRANSKPLGNDL